MKKNICELKMSTAIVDGYHRLIDKYTTVPFGLLRFDARTPSDPWLRYMIRSNSPGMLAGDVYNMTFNLADDTALGIETQAYQRIYEMNEGGKAYQDVQVTVGKNALFHYVPHPTVPHRNSDYSAKNTIHLKKSSKLIWGEVITCGRKLYGEEFVFKRFLSHTEVFVDNELIFNDKLLFEPGKLDVNSMGQLEGYTHQATLFAYQDDLSEDEIYQGLLESVEFEEDIEFGLSAALKGALVIRIVGNSGEQLYKILKKIEDHILAAAIV